MLSSLSARCTFAVVTTIAVTFGGCARERAVEAPVVEIAIPSLEAGAPALEVMPAARAEPWAPPATQMTGRWEGVGIQDDGQTWPMIVDLSTVRAGACAVVDYPTVPCKATWFCTGESNGLVSAREKVAPESLGRCVDNGAMTWRIGPGDMLEWSWVAQGQSAHARLRRAP
jgi:hypothetical protein